MPNTTKKKLLQALEAFPDDSKIIFKFHQEIVLNLQAQLEAQGHCPLCWLDEIDEILPGNESDAKSDEIVITFNLPSKELTK